jgi:hypothetical protein
MLHVQRNTSKGNKKKDSKDKDYMDGTTEDEVREKLISKRK